MNQETHARLAHMPVALFATIMGLAGLSLAWRKSVEVLQTPEIVWQIMMAGTAILFIIIALAFVVRIVRHPQQVLADFQHPIKTSFFPAFSISLMLLAAGFPESMHKSASLIWSLGVLIHLMLTLNLMNQWIHHNRWQIQHTTPAWFIPIVGNIVAPIAGVDLGFVEVSWFFFATGALFWIILKVLVFNRIIFHEPIPDKLLPTLFILIAPPAVGFLAYIKLNNGVVDNFAHFLYYCAMFLVLLMIVQIPRFSRLPFFISWWAYSFPLAAFTIGTQVMAAHTQTLFFETLSQVMLTLVTLLIAFLVFKTVKGALSGAIFQPD